jgi:CHAT domain-containing protein/tetratricopeptide (TPR) repeat protein
MQSEENKMRVNPPAAPLWVAVVAALALQPAVAQPSQQRFQELFSAGDYSAALIEAQKNEAAARRAGTNNINYVSALNDLARANFQLGHYTEAVKMFRQVVDALQRNIPANDPRLLQAKNNLADVFLKLTRYGEAEKLYKQTLDVMSQTLPASDPAIIELTTRLGTVYMGQSRTDAAERLFDQALSNAEQAGLSNSAQVAVTLNNLSKIYEDQGRFTKAEEALKRALKINETVRGENHPEVAYNLNNLAHLYERLGRYAEAERLYRRVIGVWEAMNPEHPELATALQNLGTVYADEEQLDDAEALYKRALNIRQKVFGGNTFLVATELNNLAQLYEVQSRYRDVEMFAKRALAIVENVKGPSDPDTAKVLRKLGVAYDGQGRYADAAAQFKRALDIYTKTYGPNHRYLATVLINQGHLYEHEGHPDAAEAVFKRALKINEQTRGIDHPEVARVLNDLAVLSAERHETGNALRYSRKATAAILSHADADTAGLQRSSETDGLIEKRAGVFANHVANLAAAARESIEPPAKLGEEAFEIAQWANHSSAAAAVRQMAARFASGSGPMETLARESQDIGAAWRYVDSQMLDLLVKPPSQQNRAAIERLRQRSGELEKRLAAVNSKLQQQFPEYSALVRPKPVKVSQIQALLSPTEALVFWLPTEKNTFVFAVTKDKFAWHTIAVGAEQLSQQVATFRIGLEPDKFERSLREGKPQQFDLGVAFKLYSKLFGPIEPLIKDKHDLIVAVAGVLTALPFQALVTEKPAEAKPTDYGGYRNAAWLIRRHAVTVEPSVASLQALRVFASKGEAGKPMVGFGDPVFQQGPAASGRERSLVNTDQAPSYTEFWRGANVDRAALSSRMPPLPETADELKTVAKIVGAPAADIHLGKDASETTVKHMKLADFRVVYFATHGLVAGDVKGLAEPSLALTLPMHSTDLDDGLLTASEVARLKLNADWVVLSACNTIAGDKPGAEALSGLARAFFYAGARALLVTHWKVSSDTAVYLVTHSFNTMTTEHVGRAEALRRSMLSLIDKDKNGGIDAYPAYWAPFAVIGEGARR